MMPDDARSSSSASQPGVCPELSVVVPVYNEEPCLQELHRRLGEVLPSLVQSFEIVFVNDGSRDASLDLLRRVHAGDREHVRVIDLSRNFGHEAASSAGIRAASGRAVVLMDADLQDPPEVLPTLLACWRDGYDLVYAQRAKRSAEPWLKRITSFLFYRFLRWLAGIDLPNDTGDFRLMDRRVVDAFNACHERNRYVRGLVWWTGFRRTGIRFDRDPRYGGKTKYNYTRLTRLAVDSIVAFSIVPLRLATLVGAAIGLGALGFMVAILVQRILGKLAAVPGYALLTGGMLLLGSVQILLLGIIGEYIGRIYQEVQARPLYFVRESIGFDDSPVGQGPAGRSR
jgi:glycosyltransferase involved in cell wall biosynthesis